MQSVPLSSGLLTGVLYVFNVGIISDSAGHDLPAPPHGASDDEQRKDCYYNLHDANFCENVLSSNVTKQECCCTVGAGWGDNCNMHPCPQNGQGRVSKDEFGCV